ncbi:hypothetical protein WME73_11165 [Sorangium sp. So ce302]|uniref:hypothetical protein n=1 Tax=Sorangium sp. So ce302 TaxID=3133297 RepID=UPI003F5FE022
MVRLDGHHNPRRLRILDEYIHEMDSVLDGFFRARRSAEHELHPAISLAQSIVDVVDPIYYAARLFVAPRDGFAPKSIYMTESINRMAPATRSRSLAASRCTPWRWACRCSCRRAP